MANHGRTEKATPRHRQRAEDQGNLAHSREVSAIAVFGGCFIILAFFGSAILWQSRDAFRAVLVYVLSHEITPSNLPTTLWFCGLAFIKLAGPIMGSAFLLAIVGSGAQTGFHASFTPLTPNLSKLNPASNLGRIFSLNGLSEFVKSLLIFSIVSYIAWTVVKPELSVIPSLVLMPIAEIARLFGKILYGVALRIVIFMTVVAFADFLVQKYRYEESLKMTKQEVKDEVKDMEGNPLVKGKIRRVGRELLRRRMMSAVPQADVVITNPTEFAVALRYDMENMAAPQVVAKGRGYVAARIRALAASHKIPMVENPPLARALYKMVEVGQQIPAELYKAVAEILAYIYRLKALRH